MFHKKKVLVAPIPAAEVVQAELAQMFPTAQIPCRLVEPHKQRSYEEVAQSLGFVPAELTRAQLLEFFEEEGVKLYDFNQVSAWLTKKKVEVNVTHWCWRALRERDVIEHYQWGWNRENGGWNDGYYSKRWECRPYERLVPLHALEKVAKIEAKFGDRVKFFVSDYASLKADPFIMVRPAMCDSGTSAEYCLVFDAWDEPGFGA